MPLLRYSHIGGPVEHVSEPAVKQPVEQRSAPHQWWRVVWVRDIDVLALFDVFFISAIASVVGIRMYLHATGFPQAGGGSLHIAHMLWGGLLMLLALFAMLGLVTRRVRWLSALVGGIGFGLFIDELGKFVTSDNNYFFKPTDALIYAVFVVLFLLSRSFTRRRAFSERECVVNALEILKEAAVEDLDSIQRAKALRLISRAAEHDPLARSIQELLRATPPSTRASRITRLRISASRRYHAIVARRSFRNVLYAVFFLQALIVLGEVVGILLIDGDAWGEDRSGFADRLAGLVSGFSFISFLELATACVCLLISVFAALMLGRSRERAYRAFEWSLLLSIFVIQPFAFYEEPYIAGLVLALTIPLLATIDYLVRRESDEDDEDDLAHDGATAAALAADDWHGTGLPETAATGGD